MSIDEALIAIEQILLTRPLNPIERFIVQQSWLGRNYQDMSQDCSYGTTYIKEVGSQLWQDLSKVVGERVTKKNIHLVLGQHKHQRPERLPNRPAPLVRTAAGASRTSNLRQRSAPLIPAPSIAQANQATDQAAAQAAAQAPVLAAIPASSVEFPSGPVPLESPHYLERPPLEALAFAAINQPGCALRLHAPRKMGKSSLLLRILAKAETQGYRTAHIDFQEADRIAFSSTERLLRWFCTHVSWQLGLTPCLDDYWDESLGSKVSCKIYFEAYLLKLIQQPILLAFSEVSLLLDYPQTGQDFLSMLRFWQEQSRPDPRWRKLRLVLAQSSEPRAALAPFRPDAPHLDSSSFEARCGFDVGLSLSLPCLTLEQVQLLALRHDLNWAAGEAGQLRLRPLHQLVGGHPYLVSLALYYLHHAISLEQILQTAAEPSGIYSQFLREALAMLQAQPQLLPALTQVFCSDSPVRLEAAAAYALEGMGLIQLDGLLARPGCELYRRYFQPFFAEGVPAEGVPVEESSAVAPLQSRVSASSSDA